MRTIATVVVSALAGGLLAGCCQKPPTKIKSLETILADYNANAARVPHLWARAKVAVIFADGDHLPFTWGSTSPLAAPNAVLLLGKPDRPNHAKNFVLVGREGGVELFRVGTNAEQNIYYFWYKVGENAGLWIGGVELAGAPGGEGLPIDPLQLLSVLGICELPNDQTTLPLAAVTLRESCNEYAYAVSILDRQPLTGKILFRREVLFTWSDSQPVRPYQVNFFDTFGRCFMVARLKNYQPIESPDLDEAQWPVMPTDIEITWPRKHSRIHIVLSNMTTTEKGNPASASRLDPAIVNAIPSDKIVNIDRHVTPTKGTK